MSKEEKWFYDLEEGEIYCEDTEGTICSYDKESLVDILNKYAKQLAELKAENERFKEENIKLCSGKSFYDYVKELQISNRQQEQQLKEKDELISRLRQDHKDEMHQLYVNLDAIAKQEERKQVCEKIREKFKNKVKNKGFNSNYGVDMIWFNKMIDQINDKGCDK